MTESCRQWRGALGAWALGHLEGAEAERVVAHLASCDACGRQAGELTDVAAALALAEPPGAETPVANPPPHLSEAVAARVAQERRPGGRRRVAPLLGAAAGVVALAIVVAVAWWPSEDDHPDRVDVAVTDVADAVDAAVQVEGRQWGTVVHIAASGFERGAGYAVWVADRDGTRHAAGTFLGIGEGELTCYMAAGTPLDETVEVGIDDADGAPVLRGRVAPSASARAP